MHCIKFFLLIIIWIAFLSRFKISLILSLFLSASLLFLFPGNPSFLIIALVFLAAPLIPYKFQQRKKIALNQLKVQINDIENECQKVIKENKTEEEANNALKEKISQISHLYGIGKQMSVCLEFREIFNILENILRENFQFQNGYLALVSDEAKDVPAVDKVYRIGFKECDLSAVSEDCRKSWQAVFKSLQPYFKQGTASVPLIVENKILGILTAENLKQGNFDNFSILGSQLALEIRKIRLYEQIQKLAITDGLTDILVRRYFLERFNEEITRSRRYNLRFSFLMLDIDHFKRQNDRYGHLVGDVLLKETAQILKATLREIDLLGRYGGEEFSIILPDTDREGAMQAAERIRLAVEEYSFKAYKELIKVTISTGIAVFPDNAADAQSLIDSADSALYRAKQKGRNRVCAA